jgi:hypothetical protein
VGENLKLQLRVFIKHLQSALGVTTVLAHEVLVLEEALEAGANLLAAGGPWVALEEGAAVRDEVVQLVGHEMLL